MPQYEFTAPCGNGEKVASPGEAQFLSKKTPVLPGVV